MNITINVPTHNRAGMIQTYGILPNAFYWVHEYEVERYREAHPGINIKTLPDSARGNVAVVRNYILKNQGNPDGILQVDDDVSSFGYYEKGKRIKIKTECEIQKFILKYSLLARDLGVKLWGVNVNDDIMAYREPTPFSFLSYISASFSCFLKGNGLYYDPRFSLKEDYDMTIQQLNKYRRVLRVNKFYYKKKSAEQMGGCAVYRNVDKEMDQIKMLQKKWGPSIVKFDKNKSRSHNSEKSKSFDINPTIKVPIRGV